MDNLSQMTTLCRVEPNHVGTDSFVGDFHGCRNTFDQLMQRRSVRPDAGDRVFCVGDFIERGPASMQCLELLREP